MEEVFPPGFATKNSLMRERGWRVGERRESKHL